MTIMKKSAPSHLMEKVQSVGDLEAIGQWPSGRENGRPFFGEGD
jgi:hypothetical protein